MTSKDPKSAPTPLADRTRDEAAALTFGALVAALQHATATGDALDVKLAGLEAKVPRRWVGPYAALNAMIRDRVTPTDRELSRRIHHAHPWIYDAIRTGGPLREGAAAMVAHLRELDDIGGSGTGAIGGHRGNRRIVVTHNGHVGAGWNHRKPRPVRVSDVTLQPGTSAELVVNDTEYLRWLASKSCEVEVLEGERSRAPLHV